MFGMNFILSMEICNRASKIAQQVKTLAAVPEFGFWNSNGGRREVGFYR